MTESITQKPELCPKCQKNKASTRKSRLCASCHKAEVKDSVPSTLAARMTLAKTTEDWQRLAKEIEPIVKDILKGEREATAAQASLMKSILDRAYGKAVATQVDKKVAAGVIILPTLDSGDKTTICPKCGYDSKANLATE